MTLINRLFLEHPRNSNLTYINHGRRAFYFSFLFFKTSLMCFIHGIIPALFSTCVRDNKHEIEMILLNRSINLDLY